MWEKYGVCECGFYAYAPFGDKFFIHKEVCPDCGKSKRTWDLKVGRFVSTAVWYNPLTWGSGYMEYKK